MFASAAGEDDAGADFRYRLIDQPQRAFAMAALVRRRRGEFAARRLQKRKSFAHMRLGADGVADAQACGDSGAQQQGAGVGCRHVVVSSDGAARRRGLRAVRLEAVLMILQQRFAEPDFSAQKLATAAGLSERYVNELLHEAGASFTVRLNELRLRQAGDLLTHSQSRISDIAFDCGFNDLSYFNRCFRRRFGLTPSAARGGGRRRNQRYVVPALSRDP